MRHRATLDVHGDAFDIAYQVAGNGPPPLLIHGALALRRPRLVSSPALVSSAGPGHELSLSLRAMCLPGVDRLVEVVVA